MTNIREITIPNPQFESWIFGVNRDQLIRERLLSAQLDISRHATVSTQYHGPKGVFVKQGHFEIQPLDTPLATGGLATCAALLVINRELNKHYLAHIDPFVSSAGLLGSLSEMPFHNSELYVMEGMTQSASIETIFNALIEIGADKMVRYASSGGDHIFPGITSYNGQLFLAPPAGYFTSFSTKAI